MSTESENNFINELKFDVIKDKVKKFLFTYLHVIISGAIVLLCVICIGIFVNFYKNNKIENYNEKIFLALNSNDVIKELEKIYNNKSIPRISKTFTGIKLIEELTDNEKIKDTYKEIFENEKDVFFKNYAGLNLITILINEENFDEKYINELFSILDSAKNPLQDLVLEQKVVFLIKQNNKGEAKTIINNLLRRNGDNTNFVNRLNKYIEILK